MVPTLRTCADDVCVEAAFKTRMKYELTKKGLVQSDELSTELRNAKKLNAALKREIMQYTNAKPKIEIVDNEIIKIVQVEKEVEVKVRICRVCNKEFSSKDTQRRVYCSEKCATSPKPKLKNRRGKRKVTRHCMICNKVMSDVHPRRKLCSDKCRKIRQKQRNAMELTKRWGYFSRKVRALEKRAADLEMNILRFELNTEEE